MKDNNNMSPSRHARLEQFLQSDPGNILLLADAADAATNEAKFEAAARHIEQGIRLEGRNQGWLARDLRLRIASRDLAAARSIVAELRALAPAQAGVEHNAAYIDFLESDFEACAQTLLAWVHGPCRARPLEQAAIETLWLRAMHHLGRLQEASKWIRDRESVGLASSTAGVAALIYLDADDLSAAERLAMRALSVDADHPEAGIAGAGVALSRNETGRARALLDRVLRLHPHLARAWSAQGFAALFESRLPEAASHFGQAVALAPTDSGSWIALGWTLVLQGELAQAERAFREAAGHDPESADAHGGLGAVLALTGQPEAAKQMADKAGQLAPGSASALYAKALLTGSTEGLAGLQRVGREILGN